MTLRFTPAEQHRGVQVWHEGKKIHDAKVVDLYANCFVKRQRNGRTLEASAPPEVPAPGLRLSSLEDGHQEGT